MDNLNQKKINYFIAGFIAGEGCFSVSKVGQFSFSIILHTRDKKVLILIRKIFGCGGVYFYKNLNRTTFRISNIHQLKERVLPFFDIYLLTTYKKKQYIKWRKKLIKRYFVIYNV